MITTKKELKEYLERDRCAYHKTMHVNGLKEWMRNIFFPDRFYQYICVLRRYEYCINTGGVLRYFYAYKLGRLKSKTGIDLEPNVAGPGLHIPHGKTVVNPNAKIGKDCKIMSDVTIGISGRYKSDGSPTIGDNVFIGTGARILGGIQIANGVVIGANSVVIKDIIEPNITVAGIPAKKVSDRGWEDI